MHQPALRPGCSWRGIRGGVAWAMNTQILQVPTERFPLLYLDGHHCRFPAETLVRARCSAKPHDNGASAVPALFEPVDTSKLLL